MKILVMDDEPLQAEHVVAAAEACGYMCDVAKNGIEGYAMLSGGSYDIAVIDVEMPRLGGLDVVRKARQRGVKTFLVVLSSHGSEADRVSGLSIGADEYLVKPVPIDEMALRLKAIARRLQPQAAPEVLSWSGVTVDLSRQTVRRNGRLVDLSARERKLLVLLMRNRGRCVPYGRIADEMWGPSCYAVDSVVTANVCRLRKKLNEGEATEVIHTVRDVGYVFK